MSRDGPGVPPDGQIALDALSLLSGKWHPTVLVVVARHGPVGFNGVLDRIPDVSGKVLSETLDALGDAGLVRRRVVSESPLRVEYDLTEAGRDMEDVFDALSEWGRTHLETAAPIVLLADADRRITAMYGEWMSGRYTVVRAHDADELKDQLGTDPDVVVFDEELPGAGPYRVARIAGPTVRTVALIGDRPTVDLVDADCDDVLRKPIVRSTLLDVVDAQLQRQGESAERRERAAMAAKLSLLETVHPEERLAAADAYAEARDRLSELEESIAAED